MRSEHRSYRHAYSMPIAREATHCRRIVDDVKACTFVYGRGACVCVPPPPSSPAHIDDQEFPHINSSAHSYTNRARHPAGPCVIIMITMTNTAMSYMYK